MTYLGAAVLIAFLFGLIIGLFVACFTVMYAESQSIKAIGRAADRAVLAEAGGAQ